MREVLPPYAVLDLDRKTISGTGKLIEPNYEGFIEWRPGYGILDNGWRIEIPKGVVILQEDWFSDDNNAISDEQLRKAGGYSFRTPITKEIFSRNNPSVGPVSEN